MMNSPEKTIMTRRQWTAHEIQLLAFYYPRWGLASGVEGIDRTADSIISMAKRLGLRSRNHHKNQARSRIRKRRLVPHVVDGKVVKNPR